MAALRAVPAALRRHLAGLDARGQLSATASVHFDRSDPDRTGLEVDLDVSDCEVISEASAADPRRLLASFEHTYPDGSRGEVGFGHENYVVLKTLQPHTPGAFVTSEDGRFYEHPGFDLRQIERSLAVNLEFGKVVRGGSTISQQLVKNVFLAPDRSFARKFEEMVITWRLESYLSKRQILERYLNIVELGQGVFGIKAAARHWFGKAPFDLTPEESAFLAALTPAPRSFHAQIREHGGIDDSFRARVDRILESMKAHGVIDGPTCQRALRAELDISSSVLASR
jgi:membrane peptidoglycan carboxypeptidase